MIRQFREDDRPALRAIYLQCRTETFHWLNTAAYQLEDFDSDTEGEKILVAEQDGQLIGFVAAWEPNNFIHHLYILPVAARRGWGKQLLEASVAGLRLPVRLKCLEKNENAVAFYLSQGWVVDFKDGDAMGIHITMKKV